MSPRKKYGKSFVQKFECFLLLSFIFQISFPNCKQHRASMPTCTDYESAVKQFMETNKKRQAKIDRNLKALANFGEEEMKRMLEHSASEDDDEKAEEMNEEVMKQENISYVALVFEDVAFISR